MGLSASFFGDRFNITERDLERYLDEALSRGGDYADLYFEYLATSNISMDESIVKNATQGVSLGIGVRVIAGERTGYAYSLRHVMIATSDGVLNFDRQPMARINVRALARQDGGPPQSGHAGGGGRVSLDFFLNEKTPEHFTTEAARQAIVQLDATDAPAGEMTVVLGPGWPGILLHEAVGHGLEADFNRKGTSAFSD